MFKVVLNDGQTKMPDDDIFYIIAKEGVFLKKKLGIMESVAPVKNISILQSVTSQAKMHIKKIPGEKVAKILEFFKVIYDKYRGESIVLIFYNAETQEYKIIPPTQKVTAYSCEYDKGITIEGMTMIGTFHSHGNMSAFHSGVDDSDEQHFDGLHITIGDVDEEHPSISVSIVANGSRIKVDPGEYIDKIKLISPKPKISPIRTIYRWENGKMVKETKKSQTISYGYKKDDKRFEMLVSPEEKVFDENWLKMVEKGSYQNPAWNSYYNRNLYGSHLNDGWNQHYDPSLWSHIKTKPQSVKNPVQMNKIPALPLPHKDGEIVPCINCEHRMCKLSLEIEDEDFANIYQCTKCGEFIEDTGDVEILQCLGCLTNEHLILVEDFLVDNYTPTNQNDYNNNGGIDQSDYTACKVCGNIFHLSEEAVVCPFCYSPIIEETSSNEKLIDKKNTGIFMDDELDEINDTILEQTEPVQKLPEPNSNNIPISEITEEKKYSLKDMFKRVFSKERNNA